MLILIYAILLNFQMQSASMDYYSVKEIPNKFKDIKLSEFELSNLSFLPSFEMSLISDKEIYEASIQNDPDLNVLKDNTNA